MKKLSIIIPIFNEAKTVRILLDQVWNENLPGVHKELVIIESNSKDGCRQIVQDFLREKSAETQQSVKLILQEKAEGKGKAVRDGFAAATGDVILIQDGDLEYDVRDYLTLITPIFEGKADFVLGSRHMSAGTWKIRNFGKDKLRSTFMNFGGILFHGFFNFVFGTRLTDPTTMYKVFRRSCLKDFDLVCNRFDFDFELLGKLILAGYPPIEVPISYSSRGFDEGKKVSILRDPWTYIWAILRVRFSGLTLKSK